MSVVQGCRIGILPGILCPWQRSQACSKAWDLTHNPNSLSEITLNRLAQGFWLLFGFFSPSPTEDDLELAQVNLHS